MKVVFRKQLLRSWPLLYKRTATGNTQYWTVEVSGNLVRTRTGKVGGAEIVGAWTTVHGKNTGKVNETTDSEQAVKHAQQAFDKQQRINGYYQNEDSIDSGQKFLPPMLALDYEDHKDKVDFTKPVWVDFKFNGMRCELEHGAAFSRKGKPILAVPHIVKAFERVFAEYPDLRVDGELYNHKLRWSLNEITSICRKTKPTKADLARSEEIVRYYVYDGYIGKSEKWGFGKRNDHLRRLLESYPELQKYVVFVDHKPVKSEEEIDDFFRYATGLEYEGAIIRLDGPYEHKRCYYLLKYKPWKTVEVKFKDALEGKGKRAGTAGSVLFTYTNPVTKKTEAGKANVKGNQGFVKRLWCDRTKLVGRPITIEFAYFTVYGVPFHPYCIEIRDYE